MNAPVEKTPGRALLRLAGVFTQVAGACALLLGTIAFVLIHQNNSGGTEYAIAWGGAAMAALVFGGLMGRGGLIAVLASALLDAGFGIALLVIDGESLAELLRVLSTDDVTMIADALFGAAIGMIVTGVLCLAAIPQAIRYGRWLRESPEFQPAGSTERGFPPPPVAAGSLWRTPVTAPTETRSRRRMYFALAGFAIGFGAGIGVLVSSSTRSASSGSTTTTTEPSGKQKQGSADKPRSGDKPGSNGPGSAIVKAQIQVDAGVPSVGSNNGGSNEDGSLFKPSRPTTTVEAMLADQKAALAKGDLAGVMATVWENAVGFGVDADEVVEGRTAIEASLRHDLGDPSGAMAVSVKWSHVGSERDHAWIAQELEIAAAGRGKRRFAVTQLAAAIKGKWQVVAWSWGVQVRDDVAERVALLGTKPATKVIANKLVGPKPLDTAVRTAFGSRDGFVAARSEREDGFNFGSGPGERIVGGASIKRILAGLPVQLRLHDGAQVVAGSAWDPAQRSAPWIAVALVNADLQARTRARTELTQTFRVLAVLLLEGSEWKLVQTQWSHGGPVR